MDESCVVVFPTVFARNKVPQLVLNIKKILRARGQKFKSVRRDGDVVLINANDPVFASSAVNLLFGIDRVAIARRTEADFASIVSGIATVGGNLLLKGEKFLVRVDGSTRGFVAKDAEIAATSEIIEKKSKLGARPGTEQNHDKMLYAHVTKTGAYVCIFLDKGRGGVPHKSQTRRAVCAIYDEMSAVSCYETIKQGYDVRIMVCYRNESELAGLVRAVNQIIPRLVRDRVELDFYKMAARPAGAGNYLAYVGTILGIMLQYKERHVSLALSPLVFPTEFIEDVSRRVFESGRVPIVPLAGVDDGLFEGAREMGLERGIARLEKMAGMTFKAGVFSKKAVKDAVSTKRSITVRIGPNNVHDILDSLE
ncbi:MAG: thiamine biosynthesis protein [Nitrosopumilus sp. H8]|nr:MAG: thiamine biosynthesis protein [Nitrosopumilus sp. H8]